MLKSAVIAAILLACMIVNAHARPKLDPSCFISGPNAPVCLPVSVSSPRQVREVRGAYISRELGFGAPVRKARGRVSQGPQGAVGIPATIVAHPEGCPSRAFCGCGAAVRVFGHSVRELWLAANWFKFPRAAPSSGMVAVRRHHVMVLEADLGGGVWQVFDANSGNHLTRIHARSIAGYVVVNPHGAG